MLKFADRGEVRGLKLLARAFGDGKMFRIGGLSGFGLLLGAGKGVFGEFGLLGRFFFLVSQFGAEPSLQLDDSSL